MCTSGRYKRSQTVTRHESTAFSRPYIRNQMKDLPSPEIITPSKVINTWLLFCPDEPQIVKIQLFSEANDRDKEQGVLRPAFMSAAGAWPLPRPWPQIYTVNAFLWVESKTEHVEWGHTWWTAKMLNERSHLVKSTFRDDISPYRSKTVTMATMWVKKCPKNYYFFFLIESS